VFELLKGIKTSIHEREVGERPEMFGGLEFGRTGWEEIQIAARGEHYF
jgi:hypothetical protein